jgi:hypothetical protein
VSALSHEGIWQAQLTIAKVLREGIVGILQTFAAYLDDIRFPPTVARRLQDFV